MADAPDDHDATGARTRVLEPGRTCWQVGRAQRLGFLIDAQNYFCAVRKAILQARHSVLILAWDIDSRTRLVPSGANDGFPEPLGEFLDAVVRRRRTLRMHVLSWDFAMLFALEREKRPVYKLDMKTHRRLSFRLDDAHPIAASHHQKIVVIDDRVAFCGGLDITRCRWDTRDHCLHKADRCDASGKPYAPFHDFQAIVDGEPAKALGDLARERWLRATGERVAPPPPVDHDPWPDGVEAALEDVDVGIARTEPEYDGRPGVQEIKHLTCAAIASARERIFVEQQYFTSAAVGDALEARLKEPDAPEIAIVMTLKQYGWLEERTMGVLRARLDRRLRAADTQGRYRTYAPRIAPDEDEHLNVHSKIMIVDDELLWLGSANFSNRSMGFDTECNLVVEAQGEPRIRAAIARLREDLLAEHLDVEPEDVRARFEQDGSLIATIDALAGRDRTLQAFQPDVSAEVDKVVPDSEVLDPERTITADRLVDELVGPEAKRSVLRRLASIGAVVVLLAAFAATWRYTPWMRELFSAERLLDAAHVARSADVAAYGMFAAFLVAALLPVPVTLLAALATLVLGPWIALAVSVPGALAAAALGYGIGARVGRETVRRHAGRKLNRLSRRLGTGGLQAIVILRLVPATTFNVTNWVAGASHLGFRDFMLGTLIGLLPGLAMTVLFVDRALAALDDPEFGTIGVLVLIAAAIVGGAVFVSRRMLRTGRAARAPDAEVVHVS